MKRLSIYCFCLLLISTFAFSNAFAASSKATSNAGDLSAVEFNSASPIFIQGIHTASQKDLFIDVSLECGLTTNTMVMSRKLQRDVSEAEAIVEVWIEVDPQFDGDAPIKGTGNVAEPGVVTFARRYQGLIAEFAGSLAIPDGYSWDGSEDGTTSCLVTREDGKKVIAEACLEEEMLALILDTMTANSFNFVQSDLSAGDHTIVVWANLEYQTTGDEFEDRDSLSVYAPSDISTRAYIGKGSVTVESVRMVKGDGPIELQ